MRFWIKIKYVGGRKPWKAQGFQQLEEERWVALGSLDSDFCSLYGSTKEFTAYAKTPEDAWESVKATCDQYIRLRDKRKFAFVLPEVEGQIWEIK